MATKTETKSETKAPNTRTNSMAEEQAAEVPMTEPLDLPMQGGIGAVDDMTELGVKSKEIVYPEGAFVAGIPDWLPLYNDEAVTQTATLGDVTWYHTDKDRWLTTKGVVPQATTVFHGPNEPFPTPEEIREDNRRLGEYRAKAIEEERRVFASDLSNFENVRDELDMSKDAGHGYGHEEAVKANNVRIEREEPDATDVYAGMVHDVLVDLGTAAEIDVSKMDDEQMREALRKKGGTKGGDE